MARPEHHVVWNSVKGKWDVKKNNAERVSGRFDTKEEAMDYGTDAIWCETDSGIGFYASRPDWKYPKDTIYKNEPTMVYDWLYCDFINKNME